MTAIVYPTHELENVPSPALAAQTERTAFTIEPPPDPLQSAKAAGLQYVTDDRPGIRRKRDGDGWTYIAPDGHVITEDEELRRFKNLGIPPAWTDVWICPLRNGHLQATGRDAK